VPAELKAFAAERGIEVVAWYVENESGAKLARPELSRLLADAHEGDILLVEQVDRLFASDGRRLGTAQGRAAGSQGARGRSGSADVVDYGC
jgi:hypothetical protein